MDDYRLPKHLFYGELSAGKRSSGGQYKRYKDTSTLKVTMKNFHIDPDNWEQAALDTPTWRSLIQKGAARYSKTTGLPTLRRKENSVNRDRIVTYFLRILTWLAQHVAGNSEPELVYSAIFAPTNDELSDVMVIIPLDGRAIEHGSTYVLLHINIVEICYQLQI